MPKNSHAPEGPYWVSQSGFGKGQPLPVELRIIPLAPTEAQTAFIHRIYETNARLQQYPLQKLNSINILFLHISLHVYILHV